MQARRETFCVDPRQCRLQLKRCNADLLRLVFDGDDASFLVPIGVHPEPVLQVVACTGPVAWPGFREARLPSIDQFDHQVLVVCTCQPEVEPPVGQAACLGNRGRQGCQKRAFLPNVLTTHVWQVG